MKYIRLFFFIIPLFTAAPTSAFDDIDKDISNPGTGSFPLHANTNFDPGITNPDGTGTFPIKSKFILTASKDDTNQDITNPGTGTFPISDRYSRPQKMEAKQEQLEMEKKPDDEKL